MLKARINMQEVGLFFRRLNVLLEAGITLHHALEYLEGGEPNPTFRRVLDRCQSVLLKGHELSEAMRDHPDVFSTLSVEMIANSEKTGALPATLRHLAMLYERNIDRRQRAKSALTYPAILSVIMLAVILLFVYFVAPGDSGIFAVLGDNVPWPSQVLIALSKSLANPVVILGLSISMAAGWLGIRRLYYLNAVFRRRVDGAVLGLPVLGHLISRLEAARVLDVMGSSLTVGLPMVQTLNNCSRVVANLKFREDLLQATRAIMDGESVGVALSRHTSIPRFATSLIEVGEASGTLDKIVVRLAAHLDEDVNDAISRAVSLAEPLLLSLGGAAAGFVAVATLLPILRLVSSF